MPLTSNICRVCGTVWKQGKCLHCGVDIYRTDWRKNYPGGCECDLTLPKELGCGTCLKGGCERCLSFDMSCYRCGPDKTQAVDVPYWLAQEIVDAFNQKRQEDT